MTIQNFDKFDRPELPFIILCNPDKSELYSLGSAYDTKITKKFNAMSEFEFVFPQSIDGGKTTLEAYDFIQIKRLIRVENYGYFQISDSVEDLDGAIPTKKVSCKSLEAELIQKKVTLYSGTLKLYDIISPTGTILYDMVQLTPNWSVGTIDAELLTKYRTFNVSDTNIYNFLMNDVSTAFECVFFFDTDTRTISAKAIENATINTDIFLSFDNVIQKAEFSERSDEITTSLSVYGGGDLNIRAVNPLGTNNIYDFSYYLNSNWMSSGLITSIQSWNDLILSNQATYSSLLVNLQNYNGDLIVLEGQLDDLNNQLLALEEVQKARINANQPYDDINTQITAKNIEISNKQTEITNKENQITSVTQSIVDINNLVSFSNNFTQYQLLELNNFIFENTYNNEYIIQTDVMTQVEIQQAQQELYDQGLTVLGRISQPRYEISLDSINYISLKEFSVFTSQTELGSIIIAEVEKDKTIETVLLELSFNLNNPSDFKMTISNRLRLDGQNYKYSDLLGQVVKTGSSVSFNSTEWSNWSADYKDDVTTFISSALNTANNNLINNTNQEILINQTGLRGRSFNGTSYDPNQVWLTSSVLAFSDDSFQTAKLALGKITVPSGGTAYGIVGDYIIGRILAGNTLRISNSGNNFVLDETGATLTNAKFTNQTTNSKIIIDPTSTISFRIQKNEGGTFNDKFFVDNAGNVNFSGVLTGASGSFSGSITASSGTIGNIGLGTIPTVGGTGLYNTANPSSYYIKSNGDLKWGALSIIGNTAIFSGTIQAQNLSGLIQANQIVGLPGSQITSGAIGVPSNLTTNGYIQWPGVVMYSTGTGISVIRADNNLLLTASTGLISLAASTYITMNSPKVYAGGDLYLLSRVNTNFSGLGGFGLNDTVAVSTPSGTRYLTFDNGIWVRFGSSPP